jgi:hypothetical protein
MAASPATSHYSGDQVFQFREFRGVTGGAQQTGRAPPDGAGLVGLAQCAVDLAEHAQRLRLVVVITEAAPHRGARAVLRLNCQGVTTISGAPGAAFGAKSTFGPSIGPNVLFAPNNRGRHAGDTPRRTLTVQPQ